MNLISILFQCLFSFFFMFTIFFIQCLQDSIQLHTNSRCNHIVLMYPILIAYLNYPHLFKRYYPCIMYSCSRRKHLRMINPLWGHKIGVKCVNVEGNKFLWHVHTRMVKMFLMLTVGIMLQRGNYLREVFKIRTYKMTSRILIIMSL